MTILFLAWLLAPVVVLVVVLAVACVRHLWRGI